MDGTATIKNRNSFISIANQIILFSATSEVGTIQLEFKELGRLLHNSTYSEKVTKVGIFSSLIFRNDYLIVLFLNFLFCEWKDICSASIINLS